MPNLHLRPDGGRRRRMTVQLEDVTRHDFDDIALLNHASKACLRIAADHPPVCRVVIRRLVPPAGLTLAQDPVQKYTPPVSSRKEMSSVISGFMDMRCAPARRGNSWKMASRIVRTNSAAGMRCAGNADGPDHVCAPFREDTAGTVSDRNRFIARSRPWSCCCTGRRLPVSVVLVPP